MRRAAFICLALVLICFSDIEAVEKKEFRLENGLTVLHVQRTALPVVMASMLIKASPLYEPSDRPGVAYLTSLMLTEGTKSRTGNQISSSIEFMGASLGASANSDFTTVTLSALKKDAAAVFEMFADVVINPVFPEDELVRKKRILKDSLLQREEEPSYVAEKRFIKEVFGQSHPYGRLVSGAPEDIDRLTREHISDYHKQKYRPDQAVLSVVGDISHDELVALVKKYFSAWQPVSRDIVKDSSPDTKSIQTQNTIVINKKITQAAIVLGHHGISRENPDYYAVSVMNYILGGGGFASRLMDAVREKRGLTYGIYSSFNARKVPGEFSVEVQTKNESADEVLRIIKSEIIRIRTEQVSDSELADAKAFLTGSFPRRFETTGRIADFLVAARFYGLPEDYIEKYSSYINSVTKEDIVRVAQKYLSDKGYVAVIVGDREKMSLSDVQLFE